MKATEIFNPHQTDMGDPNETPDPLFNDKTHVGVGFGCRR